MIMRPNETDIGNLTAKMEFAVEMKSPDCASRIEDALSKVSGVKSIKVNAKSQRLVVEGDVAAEAVRSEIENNTGMSTILLGYGTSEANLGAGVAAISIGRSQVKGLLRFVQSNASTCIVEGTLDGLPISGPVHLSIHETGDVSNGCESCGPPLAQEDCKYGGILGQLYPSQDRRAEFRITSSVKIPELYGHCVVIHKGTREDVEQNKSERLACGIIARASGVFQNSKRFCTCDGISIWEQREMDRNNLS